MGYEDGKRGFRCLNNIRLAEKLEQYQWLASDLHGIKAPRARRLHAIGYGIRTRRCYNWGKPQGQGDF